VALFWKYLRIVEDLKCS